MAVTAGVFGLWQDKLGRGATGGAWTGVSGWNTDVIKCALVLTAGVTNFNTSTNRDTYSVFSSITNELTTTGGYTAGGGTVSSKSIGGIVATHAIPFIGVIPAWTSSSFTAGGAVIYNTSSPTANALICYINFGGDQTVASGTFTITADATNGIWNLAATQN